MDQDSVVDIATRYGLKSSGSKPGGGKIFRNRPDRLWGPPSLLHNGYHVSLPQVKLPGRGVNHPPQSNAQVKERVQLYLYSTSRPSWPLLRRTLPLPFTLFTDRHTYTHSFTTGSRKKIGFCRILKIPTRSKK